MVLIIDILRLRTNKRGIEQEKRTRFPAGGKGSSNEWRQNGGQWSVVSEAGGSGVASESGAFCLLELRVFSTFLNILRLICSGPGYPTQRAATTSCPRSERFWLLELRVFSTFLNILRLICSGPGYPTQRAATTSCPRSERFWLLELRASRTFLDKLRPQLFRPWRPGSARGIDGGLRRFTEVEVNFRRLPLELARRGAADLLPAAFDQVLREGPQNAEFLLGTLHRYRCSEDDCRSIIHGRFSEDFREPGEPSIRR